MRALALIPLLTACGADLMEPPPASARAYLEAGADVEVSPADSAGTIGAAHHTPDGWVSGLTDLTIDAGTIALSTTSDGALEIDDVSLDLGSIAIPETVLGYDVALTDVHVGLKAPVAMVPEWDGDNAAHARAELELAITWSLTNHGTTSPLGSPKLPSLPVELDITGSGAGVNVEMRVTAPGTLWTWANLLELQDLTLIVGGRG